MTDPAGKTQQDLHHPPRDGPSRRFATVDLTGGDELRVSWSELKTLPSRGELAAAVSRRIAWVIALGDRYRLRSECDEGVTAEIIAVVADAADSCASKHAIRRRVFLSVGGPGRSRRWHAISTRVR
jgi:hypothetical protein